jgi:hypothetical protein
VARGVGRAATVLAALALAGCTRVPSPSLAPTPTVTPSPQPSQPPTGSITFTLVLSGEGLTGRDLNFGLYLQTDPPTAGQTGFSFCGPYVTDGKPCTVPGTFTRRFSGFDSGATLVWEIHQITGIDQGSVIASGRHAADGSTISVTYPGTSLPEIRSR